MTPSFESVAIVLMSCLGAFVIGFVVGYATRDEQERQKADDQDEAIALAEKLREVCRNKMNEGDRDA